MGALFQGNCYETQAAAADAFFTSVGPQFQAGSLSSSYYYAKYTTGWYVCSEGVSGGSPSCSTATSPAFPECDMSQYYRPTFQDGMIIGWGVVAAMAMAYSLMLIKRTL